MTAYKGQWRRQDLEVCVVVMTREECRKLYFMKIKCYVLFRIVFYYSNSSVFRILLQGSKKRENS